VKEIHAAIIPPGFTVCPSSLAQKLNVSERKFQKAENSEILFQGDGLAPACADDPRPVTFGKIVKGTSRLSSSNIGKFRHKSN